MKPRSFQQAQSRRAGSGWVELFKAAPALPFYRQPRSPAWRLMVYSLVYALCLFLGLFYGFAAALLPPGIFLYFVLLLAIPLLLVIWILPSNLRPPTRSLGRLYLAALAVVSVWPAYIAFAFPGMPWISMIRLVGLPMTLILLLCLKASSFRAELAKVIPKSKILFRLFVGFQVLQILTIGLSKNPVGSINIVIGQFIVWSVIGAISFWYVQQEDRSRKWERLLLWLGFIQCVIGILEFMNGRILWADHIPSFLPVDREMLEGITSGLYRDGRYRVTSSFSVSLSFAEFLACITPFVAVRMTTARSIFAIIGWLAFDLLLLFVINTTQSRLGIVGWIVSHMVIVLAWAVRRWWRRSTDLFAPALTLVYPVAAILFVIAMYTVPAVRNRTIGGGSTGMSDDARHVQFTMFWPKLFRNPFGNGAGQSGEVLQYRVPSGFLTVDSYWITLNLDYGVLGFFLWYGMLAVGAYYMLKSYIFAPDEESARKFLPIAAGLIVFGFTRYVLSQGDALPLFFMLVGAAGGYYARYGHSYSNDRRLVRLA